MGDARRREEATAVALAQQPVPVKALGPQQVMTLMLVDLVSHTIAGAALQLVNVVGNVEAAEELRKSVKHLQAYKARFLAAQETKLVIAQPGDVPPPPPGLLQR